VTDHNKKKQSLVQLSNFETADSGSSLEYGNLKLNFLGLVNGKENSKGEPQSCLFELKNKAENLS